LEKIDMLDFADVVAINKFDRKGGEDALRDVRKQMQRNREAFADKPEDMPVFGTIAAHFNDDGVTALYQEVFRQLQERGLQARTTHHLPPVTVKASSGKTVIVPSARSRYLAEIAETVRDYHQTIDEQCGLVRRRQQLTEIKQLLSEADKPTADLDELLAKTEEFIDPRARKLVDTWPQARARYEGDEYVVKVRDQEIRTPLTRTSLSNSRIPRVALPRYRDHGELLRFLLKDNLPGSFPYTAGVFPFKREDEDPARMFAGEGDAFRTNRRFKLLSEHSAAKRLSTAFDSVTLYGCDPHERPDIYGKVGNSGVSIATLEDMKVLYSGFDLCDPLTSVSMTINGPAPTILAMFLNTAIDQQSDRFVEQNGRQPGAAERDQVRARALQTVRGTVQADILKEDQGQNTCIFSTEFALKMMADIQEYFVQHQVRNFYSVSISGYHIAEAGANPISQLALTLANGFTYVEAYLNRGMHIDDFAPNLSFFFSNGMDPEYTVMGRVARRIWATAMRFKYGANERSQKLKYHIQTSGRSLHAQEMTFNDIRTTLQALIALYDHCNSLHTNAYDEAITTPTAESVRRAMAIQLIINKEWGLAKNENPNQGSFIIDELTDLVEEAVLREFERMAERGGVLGAMETGYQRSKIQEESLHYEMLKHDGSLPIIGVNTFRNPNPQPEEKPIELARSTEEEKQSQLSRLREFQALHAGESGPLLERLEQAAINDDNVFAVLMDAVRCCSLGQITEALFEVGGQYRRSM
jgi:methylmalonyl-CoA mutase